MQVPGGVVRVVPVQCEAETFHQLADRLCRRAGAALDYAAAGVFDSMAEQAAAILGSRAGRARGRS